MVVIGSIEQVGFDSVEIKDRVFEEMDFLDQVIDYCNGDIFAVEQFMGVYNNNFLIPIVEHVIWQNERKRRT